jgi:hypothetical protein
VFTGLCDNDAVGAVFNVAPVGSAVKINQASIGYIHAFNIPGVVAAVDFELFDGVTFAGNVPVMGPSIFSYSNATGGNLQVQTSAINTSPDLTPFNIVATSGKVVCAWTMVLTTAPGSCQFGYLANFATDLAGCTLQKNLLYNSLGNTWVDMAAVYCQQLPGNWIMRLCVEPVPVATISVLPGPPPTAGAFQTLQYSSPLDGGQQYICGLSLSTTPGIPFPPYGTVPLADDFALQYMLPDIFEQPGAAQNWAINFTGALSPAGLAYGIFQVPPVPGISGIQIFFAFVTLNGRISNAASITVL